MGIWVSGHELLGRACSEHPKAFSASCRLVLPVPGASTWLSLAGMRLYMQAEWSRPTLALAGVLWLDCILMSRLQWERAQKPAEPTMELLNWRPMEEAV